jgi:hypothetical protein
VKRKSRFTFHVSRIAFHGSTAMSDQPSRQHYKIYSHVTKSAFLHVEDALAIGKLMLFAGKVEKGKGASVTAYHYLDLDAARLLFTDLAAGTVPTADEKDPAYVEYKGSGEGIPVSRILKVEAQPDRVFIELSYGPGERVGEGAIIPVRGAQRQSVSVALPWLEARKLALAVLAHLTAWEVATFHARVAAGLAQQIEEAYERGAAEAPAPEPTPVEEAAPEPAEEPAAAAPEPVVPKRPPAPPRSIPPEHPSAQPSAAASRRAAAAQPVAESEEPTKEPSEPEPERADATAYWRLANSEAARQAVDPAQIRDWALKAQQYNRWDLAIRRLKEAMARSQ